MLVRHAGAVETFGGIQRFGFRRQPRREVRRGRRRRRGIERRGRLPRLTIRLARLESSLGGGGGPPPPPPRGGGGRGWGGGRPPRPPPPRRGAGRGGGGGGGGGAPAPRRPPRGAGAGGAAGGAPPPRRAAESGKRLAFLAGLSQKAPPPTSVCSRRLGRSESRLSLLAARAPCGRVSAPRRRGEAERARSTRGSSLKHGFPRASFIPSPARAAAQPVPAAPAPRDVLFVGQDDRRGRAVGRARLEWVSPLGTQRRAPHIGGLAS